MTTDKNLKIDIQGLSVDKNSDIVVVKIDTNRYNLHDAKAIYDIISKQLSGYNVVGIPTGIDLEIQNLDYLIDYLTNIKEERLNACK
jgi:hypothetical protein